VFAVILRLMVKNKSWINASDEILIGKSKIENFTNRIILITKYISLRGKSGENVWKWYQ
jgi:hypothetical protein